MEILRLGLGEAVGECPRCVAQISPGPGTPPTLCTPRLDLLCSPAGLLFLLGLGDLGNPLELLLIFLTDFLKNISLSKNTN